MLDWTLSLPPQVDLSRLGSQPTSTEILIEHRDLARFGQLDQAGVAQWLAACQTHQLQAVLVWDVLADDDTLQRGVAVLADMPLEQFSAVRVQDPGIAGWLRQHQPQLPLQLILESGNHNLVGLQTWVHTLQPSRIIVSNELPLALLKRVVTTVQCEVECQILGPLLIFTTPRKLISPQEDDTLQPFLQRHLIGVDDLKRFPVVELAHGTFMFYEKDLFLLGHEEALLEVGITRGRLDLRLVEDPAMFTAVGTYRQQPTADSRAKVRSFLSRKVTRGFLKTNRTDKQFVKLKNQRLLRREANAWVGTVAETAKRRYVAIDLDQPIDLGDTLLFVTPEGHDIRRQITRLHDSAGRPMERAERPGLWLVDSVPRVSTGSQVYLASRKTTKQAPEDS